MKEFFVYILASKKNGTLYVGMTNNLLRRVHEHKHNLVPGFTRRYGVHRLMYYEHFRHADAAINREKKLKRWRRQWKVDLIEKDNPSWEDLFGRLAQ